MMPRLLSLGLILSSFVLTNSLRAELFFSQDANGNGLFVIDTNTGAATPRGTSGVLNSTVGLSPSGTPGVLFGGQPFALLRINTDGSGAVVVGPSIGLEGLAYDAVNNVLYGHINGSFFTVNQATGAVATNLAAAPTDVDGLDFGNGLVYGLSDVNGNLYSYNPGTNSWSLVGNTGLNWNNPGLAFDPIAGVLYAIGSGANLYRINPANAATTLIGPTGLGNNEGGLAFLPSVVQEVPEPTTGLLFAFVMSAALIRRKAKKLPV